MDLGLKDKVAVVGHQAKGLVKPSRSVWRKKVRR